MPELLIPKPSAKQALFLAERHKYVGYGGARGGGKSWAVRVKAVLLCYKYPGIVCCIIRKTYPELRENHINSRTAARSSFAIWRMRATRRASRAPRLT